MADIRSINKDSTSEASERPQRLSAVSAKDLLDPSKDASKLASTASTHLLPALELYDSSAKQAVATPGLDRASEQKTFEDVEHNRLDKPPLASLWKPDDKVIAIGDMHSTDDIKRYFEDNLAALHAAGAKSVGFEFLPQHLQKDVDQYCHLKNRQEKGESLTPAEKDKLDTLTKELKDNLNPDSEGPPGQTQDRLMQMVDAIRQAGMRVLCVEPNIDHPFDKGSGYSLLHEGMQALGPEQQAAFDKYLNSPPGPNGQKEVPAELHDRLKSAGWDEAKISKFLTAADDAKKAGMNLGSLDQTNQQWASTVQNFRNQSWEKVIESTPGRLAMFAGAGHFGYGDSGKPYQGQTLNERLKAHGIGTTVIQFAGEKSPVGEGPSAGQKYNDAAIKLGLTKKQFGVKLKGQSRIADYVIHLPQ